MTLDTKEIISVSDANKNFSKATRIADKTGKAVILKGNRPKYLLLDIETDPLLILSDDELIAISATRIFKNHRAAVLYRVSLPHSTGMSYIPAKRKKLQNWDILW